MLGTEHPPSTTRSPRLARRALTTAFAAVGAIALPVGLVAATAGSTEIAAPTNGETTTSFLHTELVRSLAEAEAVPFADPAAAEAATTTTTSPTITTAAPAPTTTVAPPTTTTTAPPPPPPPPAPAPAAAPATGGSGYADPANPAAWDRLARCESGGNWASNTGNGYYGGIQFSLASWQAVGGTGYPHQASRETQIAMGQRLHSQGGWDHWPGCSRQLGY